MHKKRDIVSCTHQTVAGARVTDRLLALAAHVSVIEDGEFHICVGGNDMEYKVKGFYRLGGKSR